MNPDPHPQPPPSHGLGRSSDLAGVLERAAATSTRVREEAGPDGLAGALDSLLAALADRHIPAVLVGGLALLQHVGNRNTEDIDLILAEEDVPRIPGLVVLDRNEWFAAARCGPLPVDFLFTTNPLFALVARDHTEPRMFGGRELLCANPFGLILLKLFALPSLYRQGNIDRADLYESDLLMLLRKYPCDKSNLLSTLSPHMPASDINALDKVLEEIHRRLESPNPFH